MTDFGEIVENYHTTGAADNVVRDSEFLPHITYSEVVDYGRIKVEAEIQGTANISSFETPPVEWTRFVEDNSNDQEILRLAQNLQKELQEKFEEDVIPELEYDLSVAIDSNFADYCSELENEYEPEETQISEVALTISSFSFPIEDLITERAEQRAEMDLSDFDLIEAYYLFSDNEAIQNDVEHFGFKFDRAMVNDHLEVYGWTNILKVEDTVKNTYLWKQFLEFKGSDQEIYQEAEKLQQELKSLYITDFLGNNNVELNDRLDTSFERFVQKEYDVEVEDYLIRSYMAIHEDSYNPEELIIAREEELANK